MVIADRDLAFTRMCGMIQLGVSGTETVCNVFYFNPNSNICASGLSLYRLYVFKLRNEPRLFKFVIKYFDVQNIIDTQ